ncbi:MAG: serine acetyltransferase [Comamonadaceae bacterium]|nr:serine acetyltransferase [Comamonadaceae bacterium]
MANPNISTEVPDWSREALRPGEWNPGKRLLSSIRDYQRRAARRGVWAAFTRRVAVLRHPDGVVVHPAATIGPNCLLLQQVTLGAHTGGGVPVLAGHVDVGAGAKLLGGVTIGAHTVIGANAVVLTDIPPGAVAVGVPARVVRQHELHREEHMDLSASEGVA